MSDGKTVVNKLEVDTGLLQALGKRQDEIISALVKDRFAKSATLKAANFEVKTEEGIVWLSGNVRFQVLALEAAEAARLVPGVRAVKTDKIRLGGEG
jgi:hyperosmotically inducible protein